MNRLTKLCLKLALLGVVFCLLFASVSCKKKKKDDTKPDFDRAAMLSNYSSQVIVPGYSTLVTKISALNQSASQFADSANSSNLAALKAEWKESYLFWQTMKVYSFGPAMDNDLRKSLSIFPVDTVKINTNVQNNVSDLGAVANLDAVGFNAVDYLLYHASDSIVLQEFSDLKRQNYLKNVTAKMLADAQTVSNAWSSYSSTFNAATGNDANGSTSLLVNSFNQDYELVKNAKVGIPLGEQSLGIKRPEYIEARYSGISLELVKANIDGLANVFNGGSGQGLDDYLNYLDKKTGDVLLSTDIVNQLNAISAKTTTFSNTLEYNILNNDAPVKDLYALLQGLVAEIKTDMPSAFGVFITYNDTDGD